MLMLNADRTIFVPPTVQARARVKGQVRMDSGAVVPGVTAKVTRGTTAVAVGARGYNRYNNWKQGGGANTAKAPSKTKD